MGGVMAASPPGTRRPAQDLFFVWLGLMRAGTWPRMLKACFLLCLPPLSHKSVAARFPTNFFGIVPTPCPNVVSVGACFFPHGACPGFSVVWGVPRSPMLCDTPLQRGLAPLSVLIFVSNSRGPCLPQVLRHFYLNFCDTHPGLTIPTPPCFISENCLTPIFDTPKTGPSLVYYFDFCLSWLLKVTPPMARAMAHIGG